MTQLATKLPKIKSGNGVQPLPSLIRASAFDAANVPATTAGRKWSDEDWNNACDTQERLIRACYSLPTDKPDSKLCYIRFQLAEYLEQNDAFTLYCDFKAVFAHICAYLDHQAVLAA